jgi:hypothetical protein
MMNSRICTVHGMFLNDSGKSKIMSNVDRIRLGYDPIIEN